MNGRAASTAPVVHYRRTRIAVPSSRHWFGSTKRVKKTSIRRQRSDTIALHGDSIEPSSSPPDGRPACCGTHLMSETEDPDRLKLHFAQRVTHQARQVLEVWQRLQHSEWRAADLEELSEATQRLERFAERFEQVEHVRLASELLACLDAVEDNRGRLSSELISELNRLMQRLSRMGLRHNDTTEQTFLPPLRKPLYLCLRDTERAERLAQQLEYFGFSAQALADNAGFQQAMARRHPAAILMDIDFAGPGLGLALTRELQQSLRQPLPMLFFSEEQPSTPVRLAAVRAGGE